MPWIDVAGVHAHHPQRAFAVWIHDAVSLPNRRSVVGEVARGLWTALLKPGDG